MSREHPTPAALEHLRDFAGRETERRLNRVTPKRLRPRCGATTRAGTPCQAPAVWDVEHDRPATKNARCRMHGGAWRRAVARR